MHIKSIKISNFRSFGQQDEIQPFSPGTNAVIGRNGSGKSNLFDAVQFALLAGKFGNLRQEERQAILHEGSGSAAVNAFVELVFDNSDHRFSTLENSGDEVVLRRTIGLKKDEFFLQRKRATKQEVQSLLEGAGFSKSNPYFIVQQGKVQGLCTMSDSERLALLKEVAGTTVYDEKKSESLVKMEENERNIANVTHILSDIDDRLNELQSEKEELTQYQSLDRKRRAVEYTLYDKELRKARAILYALETERSEHVEEVGILHETAKETHDNIRNIEAILKTKTNALKRTRLTLQSLEQDNREAVTQVTKLQCQCQELQESLGSLQEQERVNRKALKKLDAEIVKREKELNDNVQPAYDQALTVLQDMKDERDEASREIDALYAKQGRGRQFRTVEERDDFLETQIGELQTAKHEKLEALQAEQGSLANLRRNIPKVEQTIASIGQELMQRTNALQTIFKSLEEKKRQRLESYAARQEDWRKTESLQEQVKEARENLHTSISDFRKVTPKATSFGLEALKTIVEQERLVEGEQYFGMLMDNFELTDQRYQTAVEVAAQNSLFHVIVDSDDTASRIVKRLEAGRLGRVTFLPLNQLRVDPVQYPDSSEVRPILQTCVKYDKKVEKALQHIFNKKLVAKSQDDASKWSARCQMDAITLEGDLCSRKGALTGGYVDLSKSRLRAHKDFKKAQHILQDIELKYQECKRKAQVVDQEAQQFSSELQRLEKKHAELSHVVAEKESHLEGLQSKHDSLLKEVDDIEKSSIPPLEREMVALDGDIGRLRSELGTQLVQSLSKQDRQSLQSLEKKKESLIMQIDAQNDAVQNLSIQRQKLVSLLEDNLYKRRQELTEGNGVGSALGEGASSGKKKGKRRSSVTQDGSGGRLSTDTMQAQQQEELEDRQRQLENATRIQQDIESRMEEARSGEEQIRSDLVDAKNQLEFLKSADAKNVKALEEAQDKSESLLNKRSICINKRETYMRKIDELGSLPPPAELENFADKSISDLMRTLEKVNKDLKKYSHVNKKAYDQYVNFSEQRDALLKRKEELDQGAIKVKELVESLDRQKDEAINRTFRGVSNHFKSVFSELVPNGAGQLIMRTAIDDTDETDKEAGDSSEEDEGPARKKRGTDRRNPDVSLYRGIGIQVRFSSVGENYMMSQLSGGQKAVVAMALVFAIQRTDPAPFYLLDELDQALDSTYRAAVADVIKRQASNFNGESTQFVVSSFRPELVAVADQCYGVSLQNKVSSLHPLRKKDALNFIANLQSEEEALGTVSQSQNVSTNKFAKLTQQRPSAGNSRKRKSRIQPESDNEDSDNADDDERSEEMST